MKSQDLKNHFIELRAQGLSYDKISQELNVSKQTLINWSKELRDKIANLRAIEIEVLQEKYFMTKKGKIELFGEQIEKIKKELATRDLEDISSEKLTDMIMKYYSLLKDEIPNVYLIIVGGDAGYKNTLEKLAKRFQSEKRIIFDLGYGIDTVSKALKEKVVWYEDRSIIWVKNFFKHQCQNPQFAIAAIGCVKKDPFKYNLFVKYNIKKLEGYKNKMDGHFPCTI